MTPHIAQNSVQEFMTFHLHMLTTDSPRYLDGGESVKQTTPGPLCLGVPVRSPLSEPN